MKFTEEKVNELANKLLIGLTEKECNMVLSEFNEIDASINLINEIEGISDIVPMTHALDDFEYELREDIATESMPIEHALKNCDEFVGREVEVPKVVG